MNTPARPPVITPATRDNQHFTAAAKVAVPVTQPLVTKPLVTKPPVTKPPVTKPPVTKPPVTKSESSSEESSSDEEEAATPAPGRS